MATLDQGHLLTPLSEEWVTYSNAAADDGMHQVLHALLHFVTAHITTHKAVWRPQYAALAVITSSLLTGQTFARLLTVIWQSSL